jgi:hypothetical protein
MPLLTGQERLPGFLTDVCSTQAVKIAQRGFTF